MSDEEFAQTMLDRVLEIGRRQGEPAIDRMGRIANEGLRFYHVLLRAKVEAKTNHCVQHGPFAGMRCATSAVLPKLIGSYEAELHDTIRELARRGYERVVNIGCGEGYYAVGLARLMPSAQVFALDSEQIAQTSCRSLAELNGAAERITILGKCTPAVLRDLAQPGTLIFCDCEGEELELLDPAAIPILAQCDILVEMHDFLRPNASSTLDTRFRSTHTARVIPPSTRDPLDYSLLESFSEFERLFALCEFRPGPTPWGLFLSNAQMSRGSSNSMSL